jgi:TPP-dependent 2-oxoacid decarboxylase
VRDLARQDLGYTFQEIKMAKSKIADLLFQNIKERGVDCTFGIPGDYVLPAYAAQERVGLNTVVMTHEPGVGFAADAYARIKGLGVALVTYGTGGLNMVNAVSTAYAEESPVLVVSGSPDTKFRSQKPELHHCVKTFDSQYRVLAEVTESQALIDNPQTAQKEIERVLNTTQKLSRPGYIELPRDMAIAEIETSQNHVPDKIAGASLALPEATKEVVERLANAKQPVILAGAQIRRFKLLDKVIRLVDRLNLPVVTSILGKASFPESHPNFIGTYFGKFGEPQVREFVESCDLVLCIGAILTEMETGGYTADLPPEKLILANSHELNIGRHSYPHLDFASLLDQLLVSTVSGALSSKKFSVPQLASEVVDKNPSEKSLSVAAMIEGIDKILDDRFMVVSDLGDCLYAGLSLKTDCFIAPGNYSTMGFGVPAGIGAQMADPSKRAIILVGDGGFQMTGNELATAVKLGINPIVVLFNNATYAMMRFIDKQRDYYDLPRWEYAKLAQSLGAQGVKATTKAEFNEAIKSAIKSDKPVLIDCLLTKDDISPTLKRLADHFGQKLRAAIS